MTEQTADFFRVRIDAMIDLRHPLAVLGTRLPWAQIETTLAPLLQKAASEMRALGRERYLAILHLHGLMRDPAAL